MCSPQGHSRCGSYGYYWKRLLTSTQRTHNIGSNIPPLHIVKTSSALEVNQANWMLRATVFYIQYKWLGNICLRQLWVLVWYNGSCSFSNIHIQFSTWFCNTSVLPCLNKFYSDRNILKSFLLQLICSFGQHNAYISQVPIFATTFVPLKLHPA